MPINDEITIVRSGTSLMMKMLEAGGIEPVTDNIRGADLDNPKGYYEFEKVKVVAEDSSWLPATRGKAFKMVSILLRNLPANHRFKLIFMRRKMARGPCLTIEDARTHGQSQRPDKRADGHSFHKPSGEN